MKSIAPALAVIILLASCSTMPRLFESQQEYPPSQLYQYFKPKEPLIQPGDKITISIWGHDELSIGSVNNTFNANESTGNWLTVNADGEVNLPKVGRVRLAGLTAKEAGFYLEQRYSDYINNPIINVKVLNHYVTVLGEVKNPGRFQLNNETPTLIEMLGQAGGLNDFGDPTQVEVVRNIRGKTVTWRVDLTAVQGLASHNITLLPGDVVYVPPHPNKQFRESLDKATPIVSILTSLAVVISVLAR